MADKKISELTALTTLSNTDLLVVVSGGSTLKLDIATFLAKLPAQPIVLQAHNALASGALTTSTYASLVTSASGVTNYTLASGTHGMKKLIACESIAGTSAIVTVTNGTGFTTLTFEQAGDAVSLENINGKWFILGNRGVVVA